MMQSQVESTFSKMVKFEHPLVVPVGVAFLVALTTAWQYMRTGEFNLAPAEVGNFATVSIGVSETTPLEQRIIAARKACEAKNERAIPKFVDQPVKGFVICDLTPAAHHLREY